MLKNDDQIYLNDPVPRSERSTAESAADKIVNFFRNICFHSRNYQIYEDIVGLLFYVHILNSRRGRGGRGLLSIYSFLNFRIPKCDSKTVRGSLRKSIVKKPLPRLPRLLFKAAELICLKALLVRFVSSMCTLTPKL